MEQMVNLLVAGLRDARFTDTKNLSVLGGHREGGIGMSLHNPLDALPAAVIPVPFQGVFDKAQ